MRYYVGQKESSCDICDNAGWFQRTGGTIWVTSPPTFKPQVSLTNFKCFFISLAWGLPKHLWLGYFIALEQFDKWFIDS